MTDSYKARRKAWTAALRSGKFKQGRFRLRDFNNYCCLGVACEIASPALGIKFKSVPGAGAGCYTFNGAGTNLDKTGVLEYFNMADNEGGFDFTSLPQELQNKLKEYSDFFDKSLHLTSLNDCDVPFSVIADVIDAEPKGLFSR